MELRLDVEQPVTAWVDDSRLMRVIDNLLSNAVTFSPADVGARVTVACRTPDADHAAISVRDQGLGMSAGERARLFEPFAQRSRTGTANERGTGLGLVITRSIVDAHGGHIEVDSKVGVGSTLTVTLPIHPDSSA